MSAMPRLRRGAIIFLKGLAILIGILGLLILADAFMMARENSTRAGPLEVDPDNPVLSGAHKLLDTLPSKYEVTDDSLRFAAMPSFGPRWFAVALSNNGRDARLSATILDRESGVIDQRAVSIPVPDYRSIVTTFDSQVDGFWGETSGWTDGTPIAFERKRGGRVISGVGNSPCHYAPIANDLAVQLAPYVPELSDLIDPSIHSYAESKYCTAF